jgi:hypothetical protein
MSRHAGTCLRRSIVSAFALSALAALSTWLAPPTLIAQGVTTAQLNGLVTDSSGAPLTEASVSAVHLPSGTSYRALARSGGAYTIPNMRIGGPYRVTVTMIGYQPRTRDSVFLNLGQNLQLDFRLVRQAVQLAELRAVGEESRILNGGRTGAATFVSPDEVAALPSIKRSTRDLTRLDPRSDGNFAFGGRNWLYNNISLDGSYFNNPFGLDDPAPGGQTNAEPVPYDAVEQVEVSLAPFDVRQGGFTGANINTVTRSGTNQIRGSAYSFYRNEGLQGNTVRGSTVIANPSLSYVQSGLGVGGPLMSNKLFFYVNGEIERTQDPGSNFVASTTGVSAFGVSRVRVSTMDSIRQRLISVYNYDPGAYQGYIHKTDNDKLLLRLDWNISESHNLTFRYDFLNATRDLPPHPFVLSFANSGRGPDESSLPFQNAGYAIKNKLHSFALELNSRSTRLANRVFASYNRFRDHREPFSSPFPTIEIGEAGVTYTTIGHEPFSIHNILGQDVWQLTDNLTLFRGRHALTLGANFEKFSFFNSFNIFRNGVFFLPVGIASGTTFSSLAQFFQRTTPGDPNFVNFRSFIGTGPYKGEDISVGQLSFYAQDEFLTSNRFTLTAGLRLDLPKYFTTPVDNPFSRSLTARDANGNPETVDQSKLPGAKAMLSPRIGFNWNAVGERRTQVRGGTGVFTGRVPFVWIGNVISNPGANPNLFPAGPLRTTGSPSDSSTLAQSFDLNAMTPNFRWPGVWTTDLAVDQQLPWNLLGTLEVMYGKDLNAVFMRNADLRAPVGTVPGPDGRPFYGGCAFTAGNCPSTATSPELNPDGAGIYVIDNTHQGYSINVSTQLRRSIGPNASVMVGYNYLDARNSLKSTEIASVLWQNQPVQGDPNRPGLSYSEFGQRHRIIGSFTYSRIWSPTTKTQIGIFVEAAEGNRFAGAGGNRYSFIYSGDVNGDGQGGNDLIYIPKSQAEILFDPCPSGCGSATTAAAQWAAFDAFINQDKYLSSHRGQIAQRFGAVNPWYNDVDLRILQDIVVASGVSRHAFQVSLDVLNVGNLVSSSWGVRKVASAAATSPLTLVRFDATGRPVFNFTGPSQTYIDDPSLLSRWRVQLGLRYLLN